MAKNNAKNPTQPRRLGSGSVRSTRITMDILVHIFLTIVAVIWLIPFVYLVAQSFRGGKDHGIFSPDGFFPKELTIQNYINLFQDTEMLDFWKMFTTTFTVAVFSCIISTFFVLAVSYCTSRVKWKMRKPYMNMAMILNLFPGFMTMVAVYFLLKSVGLTPGSDVPAFLSGFISQKDWDAAVGIRTMTALIICFSSGAGTGFYVMKGYMDTIPKALDEAAYLDGATKWQTFIKVTLPLCKPMIVYQVITSFMGPWMDFVFAKVIVGAESDYFTVSIGLWNMLEKEYVNNYFTRFCAGAVLVALPISLLYIYTQKFYQEAMSGSVKG